MVAALRLRRRLRSPAPARSAPQPHERLARDRDPRRSICAGTAGCIAHARRRNIDSSRRGTLNERVKGDCLAFLMLTWLKVCTMRRCVQSLRPRTHSLVPRIRKIFLDAGRLAIHTRFAVCVDSPDASSQRSCSLASELHRHAGLTGTGSAAPAVWYPGPRSLRWCRSRTLYRRSVHC